ncbi:hypothetical protein EXU48_23945 [Occultella glacieicola]|uniref:Uncharacterized protein n=1 Tax=Occultella glacieicola TaxID=2518684 RepID=A0ABY2DWM2_9MICO|nr:hypothetical protein [Occultella glacieicola]TDE88176.1 hypothetical protein EXU48_23945 [Occultella glacieicola]
MSSPQSKPLRLLAIPAKMYSRSVVRYPYQTNSDYAHAYHFAAKRLAGTFSSQPEDDLILLPFLLLYRHAYELRLKSLIQFLVQTRMTYREGVTPELTEAGSDERLKQEFEHRLYQLLNESKTHYAALNLPDAFPPAVETVIAMLHEADGTGQAFRYAGQLPETQEHTDFPDLAKLLDEQYNTLSVVEDYVEGCYLPMPTLTELA